MLQYYWQYSIPSHDVTYTYNNKIRPFSQKQIKFQGFAKWSAILPSSTEDKSEKGRNWMWKRGEGGRMMGPPRGGRVQGAVI